MFETGLRIGEILSLFIEDFIYDQKNGHKIRLVDRGKPLQYQDINTLFKRLKNKTGIDVHVNLFRYTYDDIYHQQTKDIKQVQKHLVHSQIQTTMNIYLHLSDEDIRKN